MKNPRPRPRPPRPPPPSGGICPRPAGTPPASEGGAKSVNKTQPPPKIFTNPPTDPQKTRQLIPAPRATRSAPPAPPARRARRDDFPLTANPPNPPPA
ncbi:MAG: hypothetical protein LBI02_06205 [Opitutaceae bacterium]|nr:hypothetical protein [Opitutaceae bacterium]